MLYKRKNIWYMSYYFNGKRHRLSLHTTNETIALSREFTLVDFLDKNQIKPEEIVLWEDFKKWYFRFLVSEKSKGTQYIHRRAIELLELYKTPYYFRHITPDFLLKFKAFLQEEYHHNCPACRNRYIRAIKTMMRSAEKMGKIGVRQSWDLVSRDKNETENRVEYHTPEELTQIKLALQEQGDLLTVFYLGWSCGLRRGEIAHLYKTDYNAADCTISITAKPTWRPKTKKSVRTIPLTEEAAKEIQKSVDRSPHSPYLINIEGNRSKGNYLSTQYSRVLKNKLPHIHCYLHKLRHTFGSLLIAKETPIKVVSDLMGHRNILQTEKYVHIGDKQNRTAINKLPKI